MSEEEISETFQLPYVPSRGIVQNRFYANMIPLSFQTGVSTTGNTKHDKTKRPEDINPKDPMFLT